LERQIVLENLMPFTRYSFTIVGFNQYGLSGKSNIVSAETFEDGNIFYFYFYEANFPFGNKNKQAAQIGKYHAFGARMLRGGL